jgi:sugar/nucleoside kinase (ribokinase family)
VSAREVNAHVPQLEFDVASLGIVVADVLARPVDTMPELGKLVLVENMALHIGGLAAATSRVLAKLGARVALIGSVGTDGFGDFVLETLRESSVNTEGVKRTGEANTSVTLVLVSTDGERSFFHYTGASDAVREEDVDFHILERARIVHFGGPFLMKQLDGEPIARILARAHSMGKLTSMDTAWDGKGRWLRLIEPSLEHLDIIHASLEEARAITGKDEPEEIARFLQSYGIRTVVIKMGGAGCYIKGDDEVHRIGGLSVDVVDTTGAGDAFVGGFLYGVSRGWSIGECGRFANAVGALTVTKIGGSEAVESYDATVAFMKGRGIAWAR